MKQFNALLIFALVIVLVGCSKESDRDRDTTTNSCIDYAFGQSAVYDVFKLVHQAANSAKGIALVHLADTATLFGCDTLLVDTTSNPMSITIQMNGTCTANDIDRTGSITATFSNKYDVVGCVVGISFNNYTYRGYSIAGGTISYTYTGLTGSSPTYSYAVDSLAIVNVSKTMLFSGNQTLMVSSGETTAIFNDDSYTISGPTYGSTFAGNEFSAVTDTELMLSGNCKWVESGTATVTPENKPPRSLNFGSSCDDKAMVSIYSIEQEIVIP